MDNEIQLISDGDGLAVIGDPTTVERFFVSEGLTSKARELSRLETVLRTGSAATQAGSEAAASSGRWMKLTEESAQLVKKHGLRKNAKTGLSTGVVKGSKGSQIGGFVNFVKAPGSLLTNPALLSGAGAIMSQLAMQQAMNEITDYLDTIDEKIDAVLRAQEDSELADMIGAGFDIEEAMAIREHVGHVNEVTWSKVQDTSATIARIQGYALLQLDALAEKMERRSSVSDLAEATKTAEAKAQGWLAVLARSFQLQDAIAILELDRVLDTAPEDSDGYRLGLKAARHKRLDAISESTKSLMVHMDAAAGTANTKVLLHPATSPEIVQSREHVAKAVSAFRRRLGIEGGNQSLEARRWLEAAAEVRDKVLDSGEDGVDTARRLSTESLNRARSVKQRFANEISERVRRRRDGDDEKV